MSKSRAEIILKAYREAYEKANGRPIEVTYKSGWVTIGQGWLVHKKRLREIEDLTDNLRLRASKSRSG